MGDRIYQAYATPAAQRDRQPFGTELAANTIQYTIIIGNHYQMIDTLERIHCNDALAASITA